MAQPPPQAAAPAPWPLYDLFLDAPHPAASTSCPRPWSISSPVHDASLQEEITKNIPQMARFAFPEYDDSLPQMRPPPNLQVNRYDRYAMQNLSFAHFSFSLQLQSGVRLYGHVRRYLPPHLKAKSRYDVGRRGERALILLTRSSGADRLFAAMLKSLEALSSQQAALDPKLQPHTEPQKWFLHELYRQQQYLARIYAGTPDTERGKPLVAAFDGLEIGTAPLYKGVDSNRFLFPSCLLHRTAVSDPSAAQSSSLLPLLRCVGISNALRIVSALISERRVVMVSGSPTRLASCSNSALSMLAQGLLHWQHLYIPVLPPHLWEYLAAPYPYLIGMLTATFPRLDRTDGLGEVVIIHLDTNQLETRGMPQESINQRVPDLLSNTNSNSVIGGVINGNNLSELSVGGASSVSELLAQDLVELLKTDKKILYGESTFQNMGETAAKATKAVKKTLFKLRDKGTRFLKQHAHVPGSQGMGQSVSPGGAEGSGSGGEEDGDTDGGEQKSMAPDYIYTESCHNEVCEEEARIAFTSFFLCTFGDMRLYLTALPGQLPHLDAKKFLSNKRSLGEGEGTPIWPMLQNLCQTQMFHEFAKARIEELRRQPPVPKDAPLFLQVANTMHREKIDFGILKIRRTTQMTADGSPGRLTGMIQTNARRTTMALTSNKGYEGDYNRAIAQLVDECRESSSVLFDVMSVIWLRMRDCKGMQWKHAYQALQLLRNLLYHGPVAAITEATDGLGKIRAMKYYENMRQQYALQIRTAADTVYSMLVDRAKLFRIRRVCIEKRRSLISRNEPKLQRDPHLEFGIPFRNLHAAMHPTARGTFVRLPPTPPRSQAMGDRGIQGAQQRDAIGLASNSSAKLTAAANEMIGVFDAMAVAPANTTVPPQTDPFAPPPAAAYQSAPTIVQLPPAKVPHAPTTAVVTSSAPRSRTSSHTSSENLQLIHQQNQQFPPPPQNIAPSQAMVPQQHPAGHNPAYNLPPGPQNPAVGYPPPQQHQQLQQFNPGQQPQQPPPPGPFGHPPMQTAGQPSPPPPPQFAQHHPAPRTGQPYPQQYSAGPLPPVQPHYGAPPQTQQQPPVYPQQQQHPPPPPKKNVSQFDPFA